MTKTVRPMMEQRGVGAGGDEEEVGKFEEEEEDAAVVECSRKQTRKIQPEKRVDYGTKMETNVLFDFTLFFSSASLFSRYDILQVPIKLGSRESACFC